ncbi:hypothetical protein G5B00_17250 [Parapedobacter sp. SGR-10]|uniref:hypothetical protein n=1 Tax=Parapedobacter sp. SGR-10 TaxID=2710879 RepID=UPI0013D4CDE4|nr:hypothetical protein [Parapedobacter sp. SGR-10]NGF58253.1 hypothetical protein [Parapedobacter sp. SGR-10]
MRYVELATLLKNAAEQGTANAIKQERPVPDQLTKADAYRLYGRSNVDRWLREGLILAQQPTDTSQIFLDRSELEVVAASSNRITYLPTRDR